MTMKSYDIGLARRAAVIIALILTALGLTTMAQAVVVADSVTRQPLPGATVFDSRGSAVGMCGADGRLPYIPATAYPVTVRYLGFGEKTLAMAPSDTVFLKENLLELPEVVIESRQHKVLHILAYVREYSTLTSYTDTVFLFREKMVDYMLVPDRKMKFRGWSTPRILKCKSYYRFTNDLGLDSVSDRSNHHFSWSDWVGVVPVRKMPGGLESTERGTRTLYGKYSPKEVWTRNDGRVTVDVNVLADTTSRKWVPGLAGFFSDGLDFEEFRIRFNYDNVAGDTVTPLDLTGYSFNIESAGRGHAMFRFNRPDERFFVSTYAEVYMLDKEYITVKEAKKWEKHNFNDDRIEIYEPAEAPELQPAILALIGRVDSIDKENDRMMLAPDYRLAMGAGKKGRRNFRLDRRALLMLKQVTGITYFRSHRKINREWKDFKRKVVDGNEARKKRIEGKDER